MPRSHGCKVLMIYPRFSAESFWNYSSTAGVLGARYPTAPLGLITLAAMLPQTWDIRLVNRNTEDLDEQEIADANLVMTGGMLFQQADTLRLIDLAKKYGTPIAVGGPDATSSPHIYAQADFRVLGEAEGIIDEFVNAWNAGETIETVRRIVSYHPEFRSVLWSTFLKCYAINPSAIRRTVTLLAFYLHLGPYARHVADEARKAAIVNSERQSRPSEAVPAVHMRMKRVVRVGR